MRSIGMDVHRSFAQVAICDDGQITDSFKVDMEHDAVVEFGRSLRADDEVVLEATGNTATIVRLLTPVRGAGGDRQSTTGEGNRSCPGEDRQGRRKNPSPTSRSRVPA